MERKSKILLGAFVLLLVWSIGMSYYRYMVIHDYIIKIEAYCDPSAEVCFVRSCDTEDETAECTGNPEEDTAYYKIVTRNAQYMPACDPMNADCPVSVCREDEEGCSVEQCDVAADPEAVCSNPEEYRAMQAELLLENTPDEDVTNEGSDMEDGTNTSIVPDGSTSESDVE